MRLKVAPIEKKTAGGSPAARTYVLPSWDRDKRRPTRQLGVSRRNTGRPTSEPPAPRFPRLPHFDHRTRGAMNMLRPPYGRAIPSLAVLLAALSAVVLSACGGSDKTVSLTVKESQS